MLHKQFEQSNVFSY